MHSCVTSKNVKWCHLIWPTLYSVTLALGRIKVTSTVEYLGNRYREAVLIHVLLAGPVDLDGRSAIAEYSQRRLLLWEHILAVHTQRTWPRGLRALYKLWQYGRLS